MNLRRILGYVCLAGFVVTLAVWPLSDELVCDVRFGRLAAGVRGGAYYFADAESGLGSFHGFRLHRGLATNPRAGMPIPFRGGVLRPATVIAAWVPPLVFALPACWTVRRWRRRRVEPGRGFEVAGAA